MLRRLSSRLTYANIVSSLALFLVLSGGSAMALTGSNTVFTDDITDGQVKGPDVNANSLTGAKVTDNSLTGSDVAGNSLKGADIENGSLDAADIFKVDTLKTIDIPSIPANSCNTNVTISGVTGFDRDDLALLWPSGLFTQTGLTFAHDRGDSGDVDGTIQLDVCNPRDTAIDPSQSGWKILVIDQ